MNTSKCQVRVYNRLDIMSSKSQTDSILTEKMSGLGVALGYTPD